MRIKFSPNVSPFAHIYEDVVIGENVTIFPGAVIGRPPFSSGASRNSSSEKLAKLIIEDNVIIGANSVIYQGSVIGQNSMICDGACIRENVKIGNNTLIAMGVTINSDTIIGCHVKIMDNSHITANALIENYVFIGPLVITANDNSMNRSDVGMSEMKGPIIRQYARIGIGACLLPGIEIGENAIVGANSVVTKDVAPGATVLGIPAKVVL